MIRLEMTISCKGEFTNTYINIDNKSEVILPMKLFSPMNIPATGESIEIIVNLGATGEKITLNGIVAWKRPNAIRMPMKILPAGMGIRIDENSEKMLHTDDLAEVGEDLIAGNYIKIRKDILKKSEAVTVVTQITGAKEKRANRRVNVTINLEVLADEKVFEMTSRNMSLEGMLLETYEPIPEKTILVIVFQDHTLSRQIFVKAEVIRCSKEAPSKYAVGVKFLFESDALKEDFTNFIMKYA